MILRPLLLLLSLYFFTACGDEPEIYDFPAPLPSAKALQPWSGDINRWSWDGETPVLLLGGSSYEAPFLEQNWKEELDYLKKAGGNYVRITLPQHRSDFPPFMTHTTDKDGDQIAFNNEYWQNLDEYVTYAKEKGIAVEIAVWDFKNISEKWDSTFWKGSLNFLEDEYLEGEHPFFRTIPGSVGHRGAYELAVPEQETFVNILLETTLSHNNVIYNVQVPNNLLIPWMVHWAKHIEAKAKEQGKTANINPGIVPDRRINIARFNQSLLDGAAIAFHRPKPNGNGLNGLAQASIRGVRVVERHLKFQDLRPAPELLLEDETEAMAATDDLGNYLIYLPSAEDVNISPDWGGQGPVDVTVVGYLGTQRTEVLQPPYGDSFRLFTKEEKGGWMILKPQQQ